MSIPHLPALVTVLALFLYAWTAFEVGRARGRYGVKAPATTGDAAFERVFRVQMNTLEQLALFLPALWLAATYWNPTWSGVIGMVWIVARVLYARAYARGERRGFGFIASLAATGLLLVLALVYIAIAMAKGA
ncbi:MAG TPA: MAPEG family protein [Xanthomonadales bacterium]|nr:MAPEG family protein [Xanthomonadales bacterium]